MQNRLSAKVVNQSLLLKVGSAVFTLIDKCDNKDDYHDKYENGDCSYDHVQASASLFLMVLSLRNLVVCLFGIMQCSCCILIDLYEVLSLFMHCHIDLLRYSINIVHELLYVIENLLPLINNLLHVVCFFTNLYFLLV